VKTGAKVWLVLSRIRKARAAGFSATDATASQRAVDLGFVEAEHFLLLPHTGRTFWLLAMMMIF